MCKTGLVGRRGATVVGTKNEAVEPCGAAAGAHLGGGIKISEHGGQSVAGFDKRAHR